MVHACVSINNAIVYDALCTSHIYFTSGSPIFLNFFVHSLILVMNFSFNSLKGYETGVYNTDANDSNNYGNKFSTTAQHSAVLKISNALLQFLPVAEMHINSMAEIEKEGVEFPVMCTLRQENLTKHGLYI